MDTQVKKALQFSDQPKRASRERTLVRMVVECAPNTQVLPNGNVAERGVCEILVFDDEVKQVLDLVRSDEDAREYEAAVRRYNELLDRYVDELGGESERRKAEASFGKSPESEYHARTGKILKPLLSARVVEQGIPAPDAEARVDSDDRLVKAITTLGETISGSVINGIRDLFDSPAKGQKK